MGPVTTWMMLVGLLVGAKSNPQVITVRDVLNLETSDLQAFENWSVRVEDEVSIVLWTRENPSGALDVTAGIDQGVTFNANRPTYVLMHGWGDTFQSFVNEIYPYLLANEDCNVLAVEWEKLSSYMNYVSAVRDSINVGEFFGNYLSALILEHGLKHENIHLIGFSLGAHGVGHVGRTIESVTGSKVARLTALDPAKPIWDLMPRERRLSKDDAHFVTIVHTNSGHILKGELSFLEPMGHVDFYPSGGRRQPGCLDPCVVGCDDSTLLEIFGACSHGRASKYLGESIRSPSGFESLQCDSWEEFIDGNCDEHSTSSINVHIDPSVRGTFYLHINGEEPFATGPTQ